MSNYFCFQGKQYSQGTVVKVCENHKDKFRFYSYLVFESHDITNNIYSFRSLYNTWDIFNISTEQLNEYIEEVVVHNVSNQVDMYSKVDPKYIEGIVSAWIWYITAMIFGLFLQNITSMIGIWITASVIFFSWRRQKINGE